MKAVQRYLVSASLLCMAVVTSSCLLSKPVPYFGGQLDTLSQQDIRMPEQVIQKGDILDITIMSDNPEATAIYNQAGGSPAAVKSTATTASRSGMETTGQGQRGGGYLVEPDGTITMHALGRIPAEGLTRKQLSDSIISRITPMNVLSNPYCVIKANPFKVTVLGEVTAPGVFNVSSEKVSVLDALGMAGDINQYGRRENVMLIRESMGKRSYQKLDLTDPSFFKSTNYYIRNNDVLIVQADKRKPTGTDQQTIQVMTLALSFLTSLSILITLFR